MKPMRTAICLLLCAVLLFSLCSTCLAANTYSNWFKTNYDEITRLGLLPPSFTGLDLKKTITRGEMCSLAVYAFEKATGNDIDVEDDDSIGTFSDTDSTEVRKAIAYGIVSGYPDGTFRPDQALTRQEFFKIVENFCYSAAFTPAAASGATSKFKDSSAVASWAKSAAEICVKYSFVQGDDTGKLNPTNSTTRQEALTMFLRAYKTVRYYYDGLIADSISAAEQALLDVTVSNLTKTMYATEDLNVRDNYSTDSPKIGLIKKGSSVSVTGKCSNGWFRIKYNGNTGYVSGSYLSESSGGSGTTVVSGSGTGSSIANLALSFVGKVPYVYGGSSTSGFDCSGLVYYCYRQYGYTSINRVANDQMKQGTSVSRDNLQVGDLVFFGYSGYANHVGIYIGNGSFVHASTPSTGIRVNALNETYYKTRYLGARRIAS